jgi:hypothetical protein
VNERLRTLLGALVALVIVLALLVPPPDSDSQEHSRPLSTDAGPRGLLGMARWLESSGVPAYSLRRRYDTLDLEPDLPDTGNLLIVSLPQQFPARVAESEALAHWLRRGNAALLLTALEDAPKWSRDLDPDDTEVLLDRLGLRLTKDESERVEADAAELRTPSLQLRPTAPFPLLRGVHEVRAERDEPNRADWRLRPVGGRRLGLVLLRGPGEHSALRQWRIGAGRLWVSRVADLFGNRHLGEADNARLFANLVAAALGPEGRVVLDDMHQGLSELYDPEAFFADPRLHRTLGFLLAFWILYLVGRSNRLAPPRPRPVPPRAADLARAVGGLFARRAPREEVGRGLLQRFADELRLARGLPANGRLPEDLLYASPTVRRGDLEALTKLRDKPGRWSQRDLTTLISLMHSIRKGYYDHRRTNPGD